MNGAGRSDIYLSKDLSQIIRPRLGSFPNNDSVGTHGTLARFPYRTWGKAGGWRTSLQPRSRAVVVLERRREVRLDWDLLEIGKNGEGRDESVRHGAESQWIVAARPLCHLQYPVAYLSRLQKIQPAARWELNFMAAHTVHPPRGLRQWHVPLGVRRPLLQVGNRAAGACAASLAWILT